MLSRLKKNNDEGFTIIEVLIVLAIAGLILLIVFLAVPALQRNAANTNRKNDASAIAAAVSEYENNNNGQLPNIIVPGTSGSYQICQGTGTACATGTSPAQFKVGHYTTANKRGANGDFEFAAEGTSLSTFDQLYIETDATCNGNAVTSTGSTGAQSVAVVYNIDDGTAFSPQCLTAS